MSNEIALQKYLEKQEKAEMALEEMFDKFDDRLLCLRKEIESLIKASSDYTGYDFSEEIKEVLKDMI